MELQGKRVIVTGANTGLGYETALVLYKKGADVIVACRNLKKAEDAVRRIKESVDGGSLEIRSLDLSSLESIKTFAKDFLASNSRLDLLINNAGVMVPPPSKSQDGFEMQFGVNFLGHFALTGWLFALLDNTTNARVVTLSSIAHRGASIDFNNLRLEKPYDKWREYGQSKIACLIFSLEFHKRLLAKGSDVLSLAAHPGISQTELQRNIDPAIMINLNPMTAEEGALPTLTAALSYDVKSGEYYGPDGPEEKSGKPALAKIDQGAKDQKINAKLWEFAEKITGVSYP